MKMITAGNNTKTFILYAAFGLGIILTACKNQSAEENADIEYEYDINEIKEWCFAQRNGENVRLIKISLYQGSINGTIQNYLPGREVNEGMFSGSMEGDTLFMRYLFQYQGKDTMKQVAFLLQGDAILEGEAPVVDNGFGDLILDREFLSFNPALKLIRANCKDNSQLINNYQMAWSVLRADYTDLKRFALALTGNTNPNEAAYLLFSDAGSQAEVILPNNGGSLILSQQNEPDKWRNGAYTLKKGEKFELLRNGESMFSEQ
jgi:hypothetical protein